MTLLRFTTHVAIPVALAGLLGCGGGTEAPTGPNNTPIDKFFVMVTTDAGEHWSSNDVTAFGSVPLAIAAGKASQYFIPALTTRGMPVMLDNGIHWSASSLEAANIASDGAGHMIAYNNNGYYYSTNNGAVWSKSTWINTSLVDDPQLNLSAYPLGFACASRSVAKTTDGGRSWTTLPAPPVIMPGSSSLNDIDFSYAGTTIIACDNTSYVYTTHDNGDHWDRQQLDPQGYQLKVIAFEDDGTTINAYSGTGRVYHSTDAGSSWQTIHTPNMEPWGIADAASTYNGIYVVGGSGRAAFSADHGVTWKALNTGVTGNLIGVDFYDDDNGMIVGTY